MEECPSESSLSSVDLPITSLIAPHRVVRGWGTLNQLAPLVASLGSAPLVIGGKHTLERFSLGFQGRYEHYGTDCTEASAARLLACSHGCDVVVGIGGGKALDMAKLVAYRAGLPVITVPTSAATCAGWAALSNIYSESGEWQYGIELPSVPQGILIDYAVIATAPQRTLVSGMGDALAKWYESSVSSGTSDDPLVISAVQQARVLRDLILQHGEAALQSPGSSAWMQMVDASICLAGLVGGLGGARCRTVAAHAIHNALTGLSGTRSTLHGEKVAFGILVQLRLEETVGQQRLAGIARQQLEQFYRRIGLPLTLQDLHFGELSQQQLLQVAQDCCKVGSDIHYLPFEVTPEQVFSVLQESLISLSRF